LLCAAAAVVYSACLNGGTAWAANGNYELDAIAAAVWFDTQTKKIKNKMIKELVMG
jgi:ABC-type xylose transport system permease subunit